MSIDWVTVIAQAANFLILVYLLKRFLYAPVIAAMDRREQRIKDRLESAQQREQAADEQAQSHENALAQIESERQAHERAAREQAEQTRQRLIDEAREQVSARRAQWREALQQDKQSLQQALRREALDSVIAVSDRLLADLADANLQDAVVQRFAHSLKSDTHTDTEANSQLDELLATDASLQVISSFSLNEQQQTCLSTTLENRLGHAPNLAFKVDASLGLGLALEANGQRVSWSARGFFESLDKRIDTVINEASQP